MISSCWFSEPQASNLLFVNFLILNRTWQSRQVIDEEAALMEALGDCYSHLPNVCSPPQISFSMDSSLVPQASCFVIIWSPSLHPNSQSFCLMFQSLLRPHGTHSIHPVTSLPCILITSYILIHITHTYYIFALLHLHVWYLYLCTLYILLFSLFLHVSSASLLVHYCMSCALQLHLPSLACTQVSLSYLFIICSLLSIHLDPLRLLSRHGHKYLLNSNGCKYLYKKTYIRIRVYTCAVTLVECRKHSCDVCEHSSTIQN